MVKWLQLCPIFVKMLSISSPQGLPNEVPKADYSYGFRKMPLFDQQFHEISMKFFDQKVEFCENSMNNKLLEPHWGALGGLKLTKISQKIGQFPSQFHHFAENLVNPKEIQ